MSRDALAAVMVLEAMRRLVRATGRKDADGLIEQLSVLAARSIREGDVSVASVLSARAYARAQWVTVLYDGDEALAVVRRAEALPGGAG